MSILIKGMEMPKNCDECHFYRYWDEMASSCRAFNETKWIDDCDMKKERHPDCPLIEVPLHGRLIDANELRGWYDFHSYDADDDDFLTEEKFDKLMVATAVVRQNIDDAPTIIEAEE